MRLKNYTLVKLARILIDKESRDKAIDKEITDHIERNIPRPVKALANKYPAYFNKHNRVNVYNGKNNWWRTTARACVLPDNSNFKIPRAIASKLLQLNCLESEAFAALRGLGTAKRIIKEFPKLATHVPVQPVRANSVYVKSINLDQLKSKLKK